MIFVRDERPFVLMLDGRLNAIVNFCFLVRAIVASGGDGGYHLGSLCLLLDEDVSRRILLGQDGIFRRLLCTCHFVL